MRKAPAFRKPVLNIHQAELLPLSIDEMVERDDPCRLVVALVSLLDLSPLRRDLPLTGGPNYPVEIMLALEMFSKWDGEYGSRRVEKRCRHDIRYKWLCRGLAPDHTTIWRFRRSLGPKMDELLAESVALGRQAGLEGLGRASLDGTRLPGAASQWRRFRYACEEADRDLARQLEGRTDDEDPDPPAGPGHSEPDPEAAALAIIERSGRSKRKRVPLPSTDPDARTLKARQGNYIVGYNAQVLIDRDTNLATALHLTNDSSDGALLEPTLAKHLEMHGELPHELLADAGYDTPNNAKVLDELGIDSYVACKERNPFWRVDPDGRIVCPMGHPALYKDSSRKNGPMVVRHSVRECGGCPLKIRCLRKEDSKAKTISFEATADGPIWIRQKLKAASEEGKEKLKERGTSIEFGFARMKQRLRFRRISMWGLEGARTETGIVLLAMNLAIIGAEAGLGRLEEILKALLRWFCALKMPLTGPHYVFHSRKTPRTNAEPAPTTARLRLHAGSVRA